MSTSIMIHYLYYKRGLTNYVYVESVARFTTVWNIRWFVWYSTAKGSDNHTRPDACTCSGGSWVYGSNLNKVRLLQNPLVTWASRP